MSRLITEQGKANSRFETAKVAGLESSVDVKYSSPPPLDKIGQRENPTLVTCLARWVPSSLSFPVFVPRDSRSPFLLFLESRLGLWLLQQIWSRVEMTPCHSVPGLGLKKTGKFYFLSLRSQLAGAVRKSKTAPGKFEWRTVEAPALQPQPSTCQ